MQITGLRRELEEAGYAVRRDFLPRELLEAGNRIKSRASLEARAEPHLGLVVSVNFSVDFAPIILFDAQYELLERAGYRDARFFAGFLISKPAGCPRLHWHQDWWGWSSAVSYGATPPILYFMYYLTDTSAANGCLRVLPGSHRRKNDLHALIEGRPTHPDRILHVDDVLVSTRPDEVDIAVRKGDLIVRDGRLLHASHANNSSEDRALIVLSFVPFWSDLPEGLQCAFDRKRPKIERSWPSAEAERVLDRATVYNGASSPIHLQRTPNFGDD
ncbi:MULTISPECIES: phytanoyl-CoA dioxygenase family protein [unclassified Bradyrhizobium]|uniref:phytanoyl-CoA dioxygenase family protein n=1 Tax=unclassified Bradyrhizobium TaxID=2631580 RepID=UPI002915C990|nr:MULTISPECIES: phytanoyl-CoA dioxygenase family protein [unclassified Bradyrhizobium]